MAERKVSGNDVLLFLDLSGGTSYDLVVCLEQNSLNAATQIIDAKSKCGPDNLPGEQTFQVAFAGQVIYSPGVDRIGSALLFTALIDKTTVGWKMGRTSPVTGDVTYTGTAFVAKLDQTFSGSEPAKFSVELGIYGTPTQTVT